MLKKHRWTSENRHTDYLTSYINKQINKTFTKETLQKKKFRHLEFYKKTLPGDNIAEYNYSCAVKRKYLSYPKGLLPSSQRMMEVQGNLKAIHSKWKQTQSLFRRRIINYWKRLNKTVVNWLMPEKPSRSRRIPVWYSPAWFLHNVRTGDLRWILMLGTGMKSEPSSKYCQTWEKFTFACYDLDLSMVFL